MARRVEPLNGGLVTVKDPALLKPGELSYVRNAVYIPGSQALHRAKGRAAFGTATASALDVDGLRDVTFDNGNHYVIAHTTASYVTATVGDTGTFGLMASGVGDGSSLDVVHYRNRYFLFNGTSGTVSASGGNRVIYLTATAAANTPVARQHGMLEVSATPTVTTAAGVFSQSVSGYYEYWTTELAQITQDGALVTLEGTFSGTPATVFVSDAATTVPYITRPPIANEGFATHWRLYRSPKKDAASDKKFPTGFMIAELGITGASATATVADSFTTSNTGFKLPTLVNTTGPLADFTNAVRITADDGSFATVGLSNGNRKLQGVYTFDFGGFAGNIRGIEVQCEVFTSVSPIILEVRLGRNRQADGSFVPPGLTNNIFGAFYDNYLKANTVAKSAQVTATTSGLLTTLGGSEDRWFPNDQIGFSDTDFNGSFMAQILVQAPIINTPTVSVDYLAIKVYYAGTNDSVIQFPTVVYTFGDEAAQVGKHGRPPSSSTGDLFEDALVVNDVERPSWIRYSYPGSPESFPSTYFIDFETKHNDRVTCIKTVNSRLIVLMRSSSYRVNYLPSERDASFDRGKAYEALSRDIGCVNEMCACTFSLDGGQERLAFVGDQGVYVTDGYTVRNWATNLDWRGDRDGFGIANTSQNYTPIALINDIENLQLIFYFRNSAAFGGGYYALTFQYDDMLNGMPKVAGMVTMLNVSGGNSAAPKSAWPIVRSNGTTDVFLGYGASAAGVGATAAGAGQVWRETGTLIPSDDATMVYRTRRMYLAGMGMEWRLNELYGYTGLISPASATATYTTNNYKTNSGTNQPNMVKQFAFGGNAVKLHKVVFNRMCEGMQINAEVSGNVSYAQEYLILDGENFGKEDAGT